MKLANRKNKWLPGTIIAVRLPNNKYAYCCLLKSPLAAFFGLLTEEILDSRTVVASPMIFKIWIMRATLKRENWKPIGTISMSVQMCKPVSFWKIDVLTKQLTIYADGVDLPATKADCQHLERAAVWEGEQVEQRLVDFFSGDENVWVKKDRLLLQHR